MAIVNQRWPRDICPDTCVFGRSRNDVRQSSPRSRKATIVRQGRPLWSARLSWSLPNTERLAKLRYWLEALDGFNGSVQIWNFGSFRPEGITLATTDSEGQRIFWTHLGTRAPFTYFSLPSHWVLDSTVPVAVAAAANATSIQLSGLAASAIAAVQGQYIQIGRRLYLVTALATTNGSGAATISITPGLIEAAAVGDPVRLVEAACEMQLVEQNWDENARANDGLISVSASFLESVSNVT